MLHLYRNQTPNSLYPVHTNQRLFVWFVYYNNLGNSTNEEGAFEFTLFNPSSGSHFTHYQSTGTGTCIHVQPTVQGSGKHLSSSSGDRCR